MILILTGIGLKGGLLHSLLGGHVRRQLLLEPVTSLTMLHDRLLVLAITICFCRHLLLRLQFDLLRLLHRRLLLLLLGKHTDFL